MQGITHAPAPGGAAALAGVPGRQQGKTFSALLEALRGPLQSAALGARVASAAEQQIAISELPQPQH